MKATRSLVKIRSRRGADEPQVDEGRLVFQSEVQWLVEGSPEHLKAIAEALPGIAEQLSADLLLLDFGNAVGLFDLPVLGRVEIKVSKFGDDDFDRMIADLTFIASALPFSSGTTSALPYDRSIASRDDVLYHTFVYLRHILSTSAPQDDRIVPAFSIITRQPHRRLVRMNVSVPIERATGVEGATLTRIASHPVELIQVNEALRNRIPLARALTGYLPIRVQQRRVDTSLDTPENRFVKSFLQMAAGIIARMRDVAKQRRGRGAFVLRILTDCVEMEKLLLPIVRDPLWNDVGPMVHLPVASTVLQRQRGYREVFYHFTRLRLAARVPLAKDLVWRLLETKDIAELYEIWCFFTLVSAVRAFLGPPSRAEGPSYHSTDVTVDRDLEVNWHDGTRLSYNSNFSRNQRGTRHSYSVGLRPDITLEVPTGLNMGLHLFDAKFRLEEFDALIPNVDASTVDDDESADGDFKTRTTFTRADLYKMHAYRDAIPAARSVWILYPGTELRHFGADNGQVVSTTAELPSTLDGVGALPLLPAQVECETLKALICRLLGR